MNKINLYTTRSCAYCPQVKKWLGLKGKEFNLIDVTEDVEMRKELYEKTGYTTVPVTEFNGKFVVGPQWGKLAELVD